MQIKRFEAADVTEALRLVKREFGPDAVILAARELKREKGLFGFMKKPGVEVTAAMDVPVPKGRREVSPPDLQVPELRPYRPVLYEGMRPKQSFLESLQQELKEFGSKLNPLARKPRALPIEHGSVFSLRQQLLGQGVEDALVFAVLEKVKNIAGSDPGAEGEGVQEAFVRSLRESGVSTAPIAKGKAKKRVIALVGPAGVGKTTTLAKLAALQTMKHDRSVGVVSLDTYGIGATEMLKIYAKVLQLPLEIAADKKELKQALARLQDRELILIDTPGLNPRNARHLDELRGFFDGSLPIEIHLVLSAAAKERDLVDIVGRLRVLPVSRLLFTKLDETSTYGGILNAWVRSKLPLSYFTSGGQPPDGIEIATLERLGALLMGEDKVTQARVLGKEARDGKVSGADSAKAHGEGRYVANKNSEVFHLATCGQVKKMKAAHLVTFASAAEAEEKAYAPCRWCKPGRMEQRPPALPRVEATRTTRQAAVH